MKVAMSEGSRDDDDELLYNIGLKIGSESGYRYRYRDGVSKSNPYWLIDVFNFCHG